MFPDQYPNLNWWIQNQGRIELGKDEYHDSWLRIVDAGGLCWEDKGLESLDTALRKAERWLSKEIRDRFRIMPTLINLRLDLAVLPANFILLSPIFVMFNLFLTIVRAVFKS